MNRYGVILAFLMAAAAAPVSAQRGANAQVPPPSTVLVTTNADQTRAELQELLRQHPSNLWMVLAADPTLANPDYLAPYPLLLNFIEQHPEVARNPTYFFGSADIVRAMRFSQQPQDRSFQMFEMVMAGFAVVLGVGAFIGVVTWLIRFFFDHRRWLRVTRTQTEVHSKLLDRLSNNEDLMAYMQSPAGRRFLESAPIALDDQPKAMAAPMSRILLSLQAGVVLASLGVGFFLAQSRFPEDMGEGFYIIGILVAALGVGFALSAAVSFLISSRFGLVPPARAAHD